MVRGSHVDWKSVGRTLRHACVWVVLVIALGLAVYLWLRPPANQNLIVSGLIVSVWPLLLLALLFWVAVLYLLFGLGRAAETGIRAQAKRDFRRRQAARSKGEKDEQE